MKNVLAVFLLYSLCLLWPPAASAGIVEGVVRVMGRATQGVHLINLEKRNDEIGSVCKVSAEGAEEAEISEENMKQDE